MTNSRQKGKRGELMAAKELERLFGCEARRSQQYCGEAGDADIITSIDGIHFEVKNVQRLNLHAALEQADSDKKYHDLPVLLYKKNRKKWVLACYLDDAGEICERIIRNSK
ncbi:hypothetical protein [Acinetobacter sp.]|uniref:putative PDDEXK endonuclease n=1 Tax=Acinetobacter sp. TaxID=472 RepID=UPI000C0A566E|nr:hypothetical protein [Acinetobacter sp.]MAK31987.1 hypothetical protein [Acinetobacter sp.]|tara:strand:- start:1586 stop:1918 length:333 start_codon:yes stop_codon:yes gene_type:complete